MRRVGCWFGHRWWYVQPLLEVPETHYVLCLRCGERKAPSS